MLTASPVALTADPKSSSSQLQLKVELIDEGAVIDGLQKVANRIVLGYPGLPAVLFIFAGSLGLWLVFNIFANDRAPRAKHKS